MTETRDALMIGRSTDGKLVQRPLSPHLQVYRPQITTVLSILHRITGVAISLGTLLLVWWLVAAATGVHAFDRVQRFVGSPIGLLILFGWTAALFYHFFAGIRHLVWDAGYGYEKPAYHASGFAVLIATAASTLLVWVIALTIRT